MENKRAGFSFKAVGVVGFVLLTFILIRVLRLPDGALTSEMLPTFLMLLLGVLILASSFILLALGRIVELLQGLSNSKALLNEIRDEAERIRIESQYIYEVQKDTLVKLTNVDETPVVDPYILHQSQEQTHRQAHNHVQNQAINVEAPDQSDANELLSTDKLSNDKSSKTSDIHKTDKLATSETASRGASYAASRLSKNIDKAKSTSQVDSQESIKLESKQVDNLQSESLHVDIKENTDESTWSTLDSIEEAKGSVNEKGSVLFDKVGDLSDSEYDAAVVDGSNDVVDDLPQSKIWKPISEDELTPTDIAEDKKDISKVAVTQGRFEDKVTEVEDADVNESLSAAVEELEPIRPHTFEDRLSQTEKDVDIVSERNIEKMKSDNSVRFGSFPEANRSSEESQKSSFTLQDITDEKFSEASKKQSFEQEDKTDSLADVFANTQESSNTTETTYVSTKEDNSFSSKAFDSVDSSFENAEDSFDDIREVFDTKAKKLTSDVKNIVPTSKAQDRIKDSLNRVSGKIADDASDIGKNLN